MQVFSLLLGGNMEIMFAQRCKYLSRLTTAYQWFEFDIMRFGQLLFLYLLYMALVFYSSSSLLLLPLSFVIAIIFISN